MPDPDVLLGDRTARVVGLLEVASGENGAAPLTVDPAVRELVLSAASGDGTTVAADRVRTPRLRSAELSLGGGQDEGANDDKLGGSDDQEVSDEGRVRVNRGGDQDTQPRVGVSLRGGIATKESTSPAGISVHGEGSETLGLDPDAIRMPSGGEIRGPDHIEAMSSVQVGGADDTGPRREFEKGKTKDGGSERIEPEYRAGELTVQTDTGREGEGKSTVVIEGAPQGTDGGQIELHQRQGLRSIVLEGGDGRLSLGANRAGLNLNDLPGVSGTVSLATGDGKRFSITASDDTLTVSLDGTGPLLEIDTAEQTIRTRYTIEEGVL